MMTGFRDVSQRSRGFTRVELIAASIAVAFLATLAFPVMAANRADADRVGCFSNMRQLIIAALKYAQENDDHFPPRRLPAWTTQLQPYYGSTKILVCPSDPEPASLSFATNADAAPRSYIMNGWGDYFLAQQGSFLSTNAFPLTAIAEPASTIVFGEKATGSTHWWMDYQNYDDLNEVEDGRHYATGTIDGASNHAFADGSVRLLKWGEAYQPVLMWAVTPEWRHFVVQP